MAGQPQSANSPEGKTAKLSYVLAAARTLISADLRQQQLELEREIAAGTGQEGTLAELVVAAEQIANEIERKRRPEGRAGANAWSEGQRATAAVALARLEKWLTGKRAEDQAEDQVEALAFIEHGQPGSPSIEAYRRACHQRPEELHMNIQNHDEMTPSRAATVRMPHGKYKNIKILEIFKINMGYVRWLTESVEPTPTIRAAARMHLNMLIERANAGKPTRKRRSRV
jgi:hypothetical protein